VTEHVPSDPPDILAGADLEDVEFLDLGCSRGGSIAHCAKRFGAGRGIGIDSSREKVSQSLERGIEAVVGDATSLGVDKQVRFASMMQFLEHLASIEAVEAAIRSAAQAATDFLYIHHPSFEGEPYLEALGLRQYWWHWNGHPSHVTVDDYCRIFERADIGPYSIRYIEEIGDSSHPTVLPATAPVDQFHYDPDLHDPKPSVRFRRPVWRFQEIFVALRPLSEDEWRRITEPPAPERASK
jgi:SAM-dependent methyltransferase